MADDVRVPAGWYPDPLGLPQLRWWDNHAWTEHTSDARQPMVAQQSATAEASRPRLLFADDEPDAADLADFGDSFAAEPAATGTTDLPSRRALREQERLAHADDVVPGLTDAAAAFAEPLTALEAPSRDDEVVAEPSPAARFAAGARLDDAPRSMRYDLEERHEDLLGSPTTPRSAFAHASAGAEQLVPDAAPDLDDAPGAGFRYDDFAAAHPEAAHPEAARTAAPASRRTALAHAPATSTVPGWVLTLIPVYMLLVAMLVLLSGADANFAPATLGLVVGVPWIAGIVIAGLDHRTLRRHGMERPAHWAWALLGAPVYLVARLVATVREAGTGFGPVLTYLVLLLCTAGAIVAVPGLAMELAPSAFSAEAERSVTEDARSLGVDLAVDCPATPPLLVQQSFTCVATNEDGRSFDVLVSLQRSNGWIDWRVDDWGVFTMGA